MKNITLTIILCALALGGCNNSTYRAPSSKIGVQFKGNEQQGLVFMTVSQMGAHKADVTLSIKNENGQVVQTLKSDLTRSFNVTKYNHEQGMFKGSRIHLVKLNPGIYTIGAYSGQLHKHGLDGRSSYSFNNSRDTFRFKVTAGLTSYLGNLRFDFRDYRRVHVTVDDRIMRDLDWIRREHPRVNFLTLDRQVPKARNTNHTTAAIRSSHRH